MTSLTNLRLLLRSSLLLYTPTRNGWREMIAALLMTVLTVRAQDCSSDSGACGGETGSACVETAMSMTIPLGPVATLLKEIWQPPAFGEREACGWAPIPPSTSATLTDMSRAIAMVASGGLVLATGGEFRQTIGLINSYGFDREHPFQIRIGYRSYEVDAWRAAGDTVGTIEDPFGPGWRASWGDMLLSPSAEGEPVTRVDEHGVRWTHTRVSPVSIPPGTLQPPTLIYDSEAGTRIVRENHTVGGQSVAIWFREWPDRTRLEYSAVTGSGANLVAKRYYRGDYAVPDWQVVLTYDTATGRLDQITDARGIREIMTWATYGASQRITRISSQAPSGWGASNLDTTFEYATAPPYQLVRVSKPSRTFVDDQDRSGAYDQAETFTGPIVTHFTYVGNSSRIERVYDESTGLARQMLEVIYDTSPSWRVGKMLEGETSSLPGQGQREQTMSYPQANRTTWTDALGVTRQYDYDTSFGSSPRQWRVVSVEETSGANDPRPTSDPNYHGKLRWEFTWACACGQLTSITMPSGIRHVIGYDGEGRGLVTSTGVVPFGQSTLEQARTWSYRSWDEADYRLASRLQSYVDACGKVGTHTFTFDPVYAGYRVDGSFGAASLFSIQESATGRVLWTEEAPFQLDSGSTSRARIAYSYGTTSTPANQLVTQVAKYEANGSTVFSTRTVTYTGFGWPATETDELGRTTTFQYDAIGQLTSVTLPVTASGRGSATYGGTFTFQYDRRTQVARVTQAANDDLGAAYTHASVERIQVYDYFGRPWKEFTDTSRLSSATSIALVTTNEFDLGNRLCRVLASGGREVQHLYDDHNKLFRVRRRIDGTTWSIEERGYHSDGILARAIEPTGLVGTLDTLDACGRPQRIHLPGDKHIFIVRDGENRLTQLEYRTGSTGALQHTLTATYDDFGRMLSEVLSAPGVATTRTRAYAYNGLFRVATEIDGDGRGAMYGYDQRGRLVRKQDRLLGTAGNAELFTRDLIGNVTRVYHVEQRQTGISSYTPITYRIDLAYDAWDRLVRGEFFGSSATVLFSRYHGYDSLCNSTWLKDGVGKETRRTFDSAGRTLDQWLHQRNPASPPTHVGLSYDDAPNDTLLSAILTRTDGVGNVSTYHYDLLGRLVEQRLPGFSSGSIAKQWTYQYDLAGRLLGWRDGNGTRVQQNYDAQKRLVERQVTQLPANGVVLSTMATHETWAYDELDRVVSAQTWWSSYPYLTGSQPPSLVEVVDGYDGIGRQVLERFRYLDDAGAGYVPIATKDLVYGFSKIGGGEDASFQRSMLTSAGFTIGTLPDGAGKLASMTLSGPGITQQNLVDWRYEGNRPIRRSYVPGASLATELVTEYGYNGLRHMTQVTATLSGSATPVYDLAMERDGEGNVTQHRYAKASGKAGDWFQLDGWDRLQEAKLGVSAFAGTYSSAAVYDKKVTYALDEAHNRAQVDEEVGGTVASTAYQRNMGTNEYVSETQPSGEVQSWLYDGNGNVLSDGFYLYVYDHLDRLSEVYVLTYPGGATVQTATGRAVRIYEVDVQKRREGKETIVPVQQWRDRVQQAHGRIRNARSSAGTSSSDPRIPFGANAGTSGTSAAPIDEPVPVLVAIYGYDTNNRRVGKVLPDYGGTFYSWSAWELVEAYDLSFAPYILWLDGAGDDEHLGFVNYQPGSGWQRFAYLQDHARGISKVIDSAGTLVEQYEYDPYGRMSVYDAAQNAIGTVPSSTVQIYGYSGRQIDPETGLLYYRHRYYQPREGRFLTQDPVGLWHDRGSMGNAYSYVASKPLSMVDTMGLYTTVVVVTPNNPTAQEAAEYESALDAALSAAENDPDGGQVVTVSVGNSGSSVSGSMSVKGKGGKYKTPKSGAKHNLIVMMHHGGRSEGTPFPIDVVPPAEMSYQLEWIIYDILHGYNPWDPDSDTNPKDPKPPQPPVGPDGPHFNSVLVSACHLGQKWPKPGGKPRGWTDEDARNADVEARRRNMAYRLADWLDMVVFGFDCEVLRGNDGKHRNKDGTPATEVPVPPRSQIK